MSENLEYLIDRLGSQAGTNQCVVVLEDKCCKVDRLDYYPDSEGNIIFRKKVDWSDEGFSVAEMVELLVGYRDKISDILFEAVDGKLYEPLRVYESDSIGSETEFSCFVAVGDPNDSIKVYGNVQNENWMTSTNIFHGR